MNSMVKTALTLAVLLNAFPAYGNGARPHFAKTDTEAAQAGQKPATPQTQKPAAPQAQKPVPPPPPGRWTDVATISVNGGYQAGGSAFSDSFTFDQYLEQASMTARYPKKDGSAYAGGATFRVWRNLGVGVSLSVMSRSTTGDLSGTVPHPFHYRSNRAVSTTMPIKHDEAGAHVSAAYVIPAGRRLLLTLSAGPSYFSVKQSLVDAVHVDEEYPYDAATLQSPIVLSATKSAWGFHAGADVGFFFTRSIGVGVAVRYAGASVSMPARGGNVSVKAGGAQVGAGLRIRIPKPAPKKKAPAKPAAPPRKVGVK